MSRLTFSTTTGVQDFVINRRRTRHAAIDPCLGFYPPRPAGQHIKNFIGSNTNCHSECLSGLENLALPNRLDSAPVPHHLSCEAEIQLKSQQSSEPDNFAIPGHNNTNISSPVHIHVEEFLRQIVPKRQVKYSRKKRRVIITDSEDSDESLSPRPHKRFHSRDSSNEPRLPNQSSHLFSNRGNKRKAKSNIISNRQPRNKQKKVKSLAERLLKASLLSRGNPAECLLNPDSLNSALYPCLPLNFGPDDQTPKSPSRHTWVLIDPKKSTPFRSVPFSVQPKPGVPTSGILKYKPLSEWMGNNNTFEQSSTVKILHIKRRGRAQTAKLATDSLQCPPLAFISLKDSEEAYSQSKRNRKANSLPIEKSLKVCSPKGNPFGFMIPSPLSFVCNQPCRPGAPVSDTSQNSNILKSLSPSSRHIHSFPDGIESSQKVSVNLSELDGHTSFKMHEDKEPPSFTTVTHESTELLRDTSLPSLQPFTVSLNTDKKPLRPLGSFLDGFRERGRNAMMAAAEKNITSLEQRSSDIDVSFGLEKRAVSVTAVDNLLQSSIKPVPKHGARLSNHFPLSQLLDSSMLRPVTPSRKRRPIEQVSRKAADRMPILMHISDPSVLCNTQMVLQNHSIVSPEQTLPCRANAETAHAPRPNSSAQILSMLQPQPYQITLCSPSNSPNIRCTQNLFSQHP